VGDTSEMARRIIQLATDNELRKKMGKAARTRAVEVFPEGKVVGMYERVYEEVAG